MTDIVPPVANSTSAASPAVPARPVAPPKSALRQSSRPSVPVSSYDVRRRSSQVLLELGNTKLSDQHEGLENQSMQPTVASSSLSQPAVPKRRTNPLNQQQQRQQQQQQQYQTQTDDMPLSPRPNSMAVFSSNPPSPFFEREEFVASSATTQVVSSSSSSPPGTPSSPQSRASVTYTDPFSDNHRASTLSNFSAAAAADDSPVGSAIRTPSISSIVSLSTKGTLPNFDTHVMYKIKTSNSSKKLSNFFGEQIPLDVCVKEIEREGLGALLHSKVPLCYFLRFLLDEYSSENLFFFIEVEQYESFAYLSRAQQLATAQHIYETYLTRHSQFEVNVEDRVRKTVVMSLRDQSDLLHCFEPAKRSVFALLEGSYTRHRLGSGWERMVREIGENTIHYDTNARNMAVNHLLEHIRRQHDALYHNPHTDAIISNTSRRRHELLKSMIHEFCRSMVGVDFDYYRPEPEFTRQPLPPHPSSANPRSRSPTHNSDGDNSSEGEGSGVKINNGRQRSKSFVTRRNKDKLEGLFGKKGKPAGGKA